MNTVRLAAAGAGKTWKICHDALEATHSDCKSRVLMITYTNKGVESIESELKKQSHGIIPCEIKVVTWYQFLLAELIRPYQTYIANINEIKGYDYSLQYVKNYAASGTKRRYITQGHNVRSEEASNLVMLLDEKSRGKVFSRLQKAYSHIFIDEVQDMAGRDIDILKNLFRTDMQITCVGDNKQATFRTHNTRTNRRLSGENIFDFFRIVEKNGLAKIETNLCSRRFNADICQFANQAYPNENNITTCMTEITGHDGVYIIERKDAAKYYSYYHPQELRYDSRSNGMCGDFALNFGVCKGKTFDRCLIHANNPIIQFLKGKPLSSAPKYYVALTRARYSNTIVVDRLFSADGFEPCTIQVYDGEISALRFVRSN